MTERPGRPAAPAIDPERLYAELERAILGSARSLNRVQVAEQAGVPLDRAIELWRALGFPGTDSDTEPRYSQADVEALRLVGWLVETGFIDQAVEVTLVRSMGRSFARLAEWEIAELSAAALAGSMETDQSRLEELMTSLIPVVEDLHAYVYRRHLANAAARMLLLPGGDDGVRMAVGFADIVGFTRRSRGLSQAELARLVETFEATSAAIVTNHRGRVIKTIGDEVLFVADDPVDGARIARALVEAHDEEFPEVRVGVAYGDVVSRLGDVFGPVVNVASRLTSIARPGRVLVDRDLHEVLQPLT
ncbi:MAG TPA: adenylate/guanylate cyclase domain-containing protein, partial [Marmoricola sp.]|nr:adenylate/guanylate cyclase domain-containing protein [Marmoricola sp.]